MVLLFVMSNVRGALTTAIAQERERVAQEHERQARADAIATREIASAPGNDRKVPRLQHFSTNYAGIPEAVSSRVPSIWSRLSVG